MGAQNRTRRSRGDIVLLASVVLAVMAVTLFPPAARAQSSLELEPSCTDATGQPFLPWLDPARYALVPDGSLERGGRQWTVANGAAIVAGNEPFHVNSAADRHSLSLPDGASATTGRICLAVDRPTLRFFAVNSGSPLSALSVEAIFVGPLGELATVDVGLLFASEAWAPTPHIAIPASAAAPAGADAVRFRFTPVGGGGQWRIDDVYVDPFVSR